MKDNRDGAPPHYTQPYEEGDTVFEYPIKNPPWHRTDVKAPSHDGLEDVSQKKRDYRYIKPLVYLWIGAIVLFYLQNSIALGLVFGLWMTTLYRPIIREAVLARRNRAAERHDAVP